MGNLGRYLCATCHETTLHRGNFCIHCNTSLLPDGYRPAMPRFTSVVRHNAAAGKKRTVDKALLTRVCGWCQSYFVVPHLSYPARCCSVVCAQRKRRHEQRVLVPLYFPPVQRLEPHATEPRPQEHELSDIPILKAG